MTIEHNQNDIESLRRDLTASHGRNFWRSFEEFADKDGVQEALRRAFPRQASLLGGILDRREFMKLMGASFALAGLTSCSSQDREKIVPYIKSPEEVVPGKPLFYASSVTQNGVATGVLVESHMGRPTKIEGNPDHPASRGATNAQAQAAILSLYDPDRSQTSRYFGEIRPWNIFLRDLRVALGGVQPKQGEGFWLLTETITSPSLTFQLRKLQQQYPKMRWVQYEPAGRECIREGAKLAFGEYVETVYRFGQAEVVVSLDADFLASGPGSVRYAQDFMAKRRVGEEHKKMNRLYVLEPAPSCTGSTADHRIPVRAGDIEGVARALAAKLGIATAGPEKFSALAETLAKDLQAHRGKCLVVVGEHQPPAVHALAHAINGALGNIGETVYFTEPLETNPEPQTEGLRQLVQEMNAGRVDMLAIVDANPVYSAPVDFNFKDAIKKAKFCVHLGLHFDETAALCQWHIPETHFLESWGDARAFDGTVTIQQPLINPLYTDAKSPYEFLAAFSTEFNQSSYEVVRGYWMAQKADGGFDKYWRRVLHDGFIADSAFPPKAVTVSAGLASALPAYTPPADTALEIVFRPDPAVLDGRFANNGWLQEMPKPMTTLTWDNAVMVGPKMAQARNIGQNGLRNLKNSEPNGVGYESGHTDVVELRVGGKSVKAPVFVLPGMAENSVVVHLGYGRERAGKVGSNLGFNAYQVRTSANPWFAHGLEIIALGEDYQLATTQTHHTMGDEKLELKERSIVRRATLEEFLKKPEFAKEEGDEPKNKITLYREGDHVYDGYAWGMVVDTSTCIGCNACVVACVAENNIPVVGKVEVLREREMHWIRIDRYFSGNLDNPDIHHQPVMCQHCENAPCEVVCPVQATAHSAEGLNEMAYNRCVGTKYCANNCPYKVRRFNFFSYSDYDTPSLKLGRNPDVTVRSRGVMEKCTFCVQRINAGRIDAEKEGRQLRDGEIITACQGACPTRAITFGNLNDKQSAVAKLVAEPTNYGLLADMNTRPRVSYLAEVRNPNPELKA